MKEFFIKSRFGKDIHIQIRLANVGGKEESLPVNNCACIEFVSHGFSIFMAGKRFKASDAMVGFYKEHQITQNVNLLEIPHGTDDDNYEASIPKFFTAADCIHAHLSRQNNVLVNCNNGRSRTGSVLAAYLMKHHDMMAEIALSIVTAALEIRGFSKDRARIDIDINAHKGTYGDWLKRWEKAKDSPPDKENASLKRFSFLRTLTLNNNSKRAFMTALNDITKKASPLRP